MLFEYCYCVLAGDKVCTSRDLWSLPRVYLVVVVELCPQGPFVVRLRGLSRSFVQRYGERDTIEIDRMDRPTSDVRRVISFDNIYYLIDTAVYFSSSRSYPDTSRRTRYGVARTAVRYSRAVGPTPRAGGPIGARSRSAPPLYVWDVWAIASLSLSARNLLRLLKGHSTTTNRSL